MKLVIRAAAFNISCIIVFGFVYWSIRNHFTKDQFLAKMVYGEPLDFFFLSTGIQSSVGYKDLTATTNLSKIALMIQQFIMITTNIFLLYIFTL